MPVPVITAWSEAVSYLEGLAGTVRGDVRPLLQAGGKAPFAISREVFCYADHLGHLYCGPSNVTDRLKRFLREVMSKADVRYAQRAEEIYQMFRCGPVHEFEPKILENRQGERLGWLYYPGMRSDSVILDGISYRVTHLTPILRRDRMYALPVSSDCLIDDLEEAIKTFCSLGPSDERLTLWNRAARDLSIDRPCDFKV